MPTPANLVHQSSTTAGTGNFTLGPVVGALGKQDFSEAFGTGSGNTFDYFIMNREVKEWEVGVGYMSDTTTLIRQSVVENSNGDTSPISFGAGTKDVTNDVTALNALTTDQGMLGRFLYLDADRDTYIDSASDDTLDTVVGGVPVSIATDVDVSFLSGVDVDVKGGFDAQASFSLAGDISPAALIADTHNWNPPGLSTASTIRIAVTATGVELTGITGGTDGRVLILHNIGPEFLALPHQDTRSSVNNRFFFGTDKHLHPDETMSLRYDSSSGAWRSIGESQTEPQSFGIACSDEKTTDLAMDTDVASFRMPFPFTLYAGIAGVRASVSEAPTGSGITVDINRNGTSILSAGGKLNIDAGQKTSTTAATAPSIAFPFLPDDSEITIDIDAVGSTTPGKGLKVYLIGYPSCAS